MATLVAASSQPKSGVGSLAETNRLLGNSSSGSSSGSSSSGGRDTLPEGVAYQTFNPDGSVRTSQTASQKTASDKAAIANGTDTPIGIGGELKNQDISQIGVSSKPIDTTQPSPTTVNATPFTQGAAGAGAGAGAPAPVTTPTPEPTAAQQGHAAATASGSAAPQTAGPGMSSATSTMRNMPQSYTSPAPVVQAYQDATQKLTDDYNKAMSTQGQGESLVQQYQDFTKQLGIPALNTELMNMKNIIDGTEDDVRNEVTKAGGFATDSQVLAMTNARNKTMIQNYNNLLQTRSDMQQQVQTMVGLAAQDRAYMSQQIDRQLNFDQQQVTFADKALTNAQSSIQKSIDIYGAKSVLQQALATGDPTAVARINATMSASGSPFDLHQAALAPPTLDEQLKRAQLANIYSEIGARNQANTPINVDVSAAVAKNPNLDSYTANKSAITQILTNPKIGQGTKTQVANSLGVIDAANALAANNQNGKFEGINPLTGILNTKIPFTNIGLPFRDNVKSTNQINNEQYINAVNLKTQQWASGATLSQEQTNQVKQLTPTVSDSDKIVRSKLNGLVDFMLTQTQSQLESQGVGFQPAKVNLFETYDLIQKASPEQLKQLKDQGLIK